jgi:hypothetical protein
MLRATEERRRPPSSSLFLFSSPGAPSVACFSEKTASAPLVLFSFSLTLSSAILVDVRVDKTIDVNGRKKECGSFPRSKQEGLIC